MSFWNNNQDEERRRNDERLRQERIREEDRRREMERQEAMAKADAKRRAEKIKADRAAKEKKILDEKRRELHEAFEKAIQGMQNGSQKPQVSLGRGGGFQDGAGGAYRQQGHHKAKMGERIGPPVGYSRETLEAQAEARKIGSGGSLSSKLKF